MLERESALPTVYKAFQKFSIPSGGYSRNARPSNLIFEQDLYNSREVKYCIYLSKISIFIFIYVLIYYVQQSNEFWRNNIIKYWYDGTVLLSDLETTCTHSLGWKADSKSSISSTALSWDKGSRILDAMHTYILILYPCQPTTLHSHHPPVSPRPCPFLVAPRLL